MSAIQDQQRILHEIERGLRRDRRFAARCALLSLRVAFTCTALRVLAALETLLLGLVALGAVAGWQALLIPAIGASLALPIVVVTLRGDAGGSRRQVSGQIPNLWWML